jgi:surface antigen
MYLAIKQFIREHRLEIIMGLLTALFIANIPTIAHASGNNIIKDELIKPNPITFVERLSKPKIKKQSILTKIVVKPVRKAVVKPQPVRKGSRAPVGWFEPGQCTHFVWSKRFVPQWNDASDWLWQARRDGWTVSRTPVAGAIAWKPGHVALVNSVSGGSISLSEANYDYNGSVRTITIPASDYPFYLY